MKAYRLSHKARRDLDDIWDYSRDLWGARRGASYLHDIRTAIELVAERPSIGAALEDLLHQNMDALRALSEH